MSARNEYSFSSTAEFAGITWPDYLVIVAYFLFVLAVGLYVGAYSSLTSIFHFAK